MAGTSATQGQNWALGETQPISPTMVNEFRLGFSQKGQTIAPWGNGENLNDQFGIPGLNLPGRHITSGLADISFSGNSGVGISPYEPDFIFDNVFDVADNFSFIKGRSNFKTGFSVLRPNFDRCIL